MARAQVTERFYRYLVGAQVDRAPDVEFGYWPQTIRRWLHEGLPKSLDDWWYQDRERLSELESQEMFNKKLDEYFGLDTSGEEISLRVHMNPSFPEEVLSRENDRTLVRDQGGVVAERYLTDVQESSIPHFISFPVTDRADWEKLRRRYLPGDPTRRFPDSQIVRARTAIAEGKMVTAGMAGFYGQLRNWMGFENLSLCFYDDPGLVHRMVETWADLCVEQIRKLPADIPLDYVSWWEDMASKNGPFVSPEQFRTFFLPAYTRVMAEARKRGCTLSIVDCDGNPGVLVPLWMEAGVNIMFPLEVLAGVDPLAWRKQHGSALLLKGGINKEAIAAGGAEIVRELERIKPLLDQGGYVPHLDHLVPPNVSYGNFLTYLEAKGRLLGR
ncbi:MAG: uroporphyrinogen decarboxylase family protein [Spirochaetia bacterium]